MQLAYPPNQLEVMGWINSALPSGIKLVKRLQELTDGVAYLHLLRHIFPSTIDRSQIIDHPCNNQQVHANYRRLSEVFQQEGLPLAINLQQLAHPNLYEHFKICIFLFEKLSRTSPANRTMKSSQSQRIKIIPPTSIKTLLLQKGLSAQISLSELQSLHARPKINQILAQIDKDGSPDIQLQVLQPSLQALDSKQEAKYRQNGKQKITALLNTSYQMNSNQNFIEIHPKNAKEIDSCIMKTFRIQNRQRFWHYHIQVTTNYLQNIQYIHSLSVQEKQLIRKVKDAPSTIKAINMLFFDENQDKKTTSNMRKYCANFYRSVHFMKQLVGNHYLKMSFKKNALTYFKKYQLLPMNELSKQEFEQYYKHYIDLSIVVDKKILSYSQMAQTQPLKRQMDSVSSFSLERSCQISHYQMENESISNEITFQFSNMSKPEETQWLQIGCEFDPYKQDICEQQYWTLHRITMIAFQLQFIKKKDPQYDPLDLTHRSITPHSKFVTGLLFTCLKNHKDQQQKIFPRAAASYPASSYPHLAQLLNKKVNQQQGQIKLAEFIRILLLLKHQTVLPLFLQAYQLIVCAIKGLKFSDLKCERQRFAIVDSITQKLRKNAEELDQMLKEILQIQSSHDSIQLLRVTVYCILAERFSFHTNEFWTQAFPPQEAFKYKASTKVKTEVKKSEAGSEDRMEYANWIQ